MRTSIFWTREGGMVGGVFFTLALMAAGSLIIFGRIPLGQYSLSTRASHPWLTRIAGVALVGIILFARFFGQHPTILLIAAVVALLLLAAAVLFG